MRRDYLSFEEREHHHVLPFLSGSHQHYCHFHVAFYLAFCQTA